LPKKIGILSQNLEQNLEFKFLTRYMCKIHFIKLFENVSKKCQTKQETIDEIRAEIALIEQDPNATEDRKRIAAEMQSRIDKIEESAKSRIDQIDQIEESAKSRIDQIEESAKSRIDQIDQIEESAKSRIDQIEESAKSRIDQIDQIEESAKSRIDQIEESAKSRIDQIESQPLNSGSINSGSTNQIAFALIGLFFVI